MPKIGEKSKLIRFLFRNNNLSQTIVKNTFWLSFGEITGRLLRVIIIFYAARVLGAAGYGTLSYMTSLAAILTVAADIGLTGVLIREAAKDETKRAIYFSTTFALKLVLVFFSFLFIIFGSQQITGIPLSQTLIYAIGALFIFDSLRRFGTSVFRAEERMELEGLINIFTQLIIVAAGFIALIMYPEPESLAISYAIGAGLGLLVTVYFLKSYVKGLKANFDKKLIRPIVKAAWPWTLAAIFGVLLVNVDTVMIGWFLDAKNVGFYAAAQKPIAFFYLLPGFIVGGLFPALSRLAKESKEKFREVMERGLSMVMLVGYPLVAGIILKSDDIIELVYGADFLAAEGPMRILSLSVLVTFPITIIIHAMFAYDRQKEMVPLWAAGSVINIALNFFLIPILGIVGAAWASLLTQLSTSSLLWRKMKQVNPFSATKNIKSVLQSTAAMSLLLIGSSAVGIPFLITLPLSMLVYFLALVFFKDQTLLALRQSTNE